MNMIDCTGHRVSGANAKSLEMYEQAARELLCMVDDPVASVEAAIAASPDMTMAHVLNAWLNLLGTEPSGIAPAQASLDAAEALDADERERAHIDAARALASGRWQEAGLRLEDLSARFPRDTLALQAGHQIDFFRGDSACCATASRAPCRPGTPACRAGTRCLACTRSGWKKPADYDGAEAQGRRAVEAEPRDSWAWHAVAHVHEMRNRRQGGHRLAGADARHLVERQLSWRPTTAGTWRCTTSNRTATTRCCGCTTRPSAAPDRRS